MKKLTALILALVMLLTLAACAAKPAATEPEQPEQTPAAEETTQPEQTEQASAEETAAGTQTPMTGNVITDEDVSLTIWMIGDREEHFNTAIEAYTEIHPNVSIDISYFDTSTLKSNCMAAAASDTLPECFYSYSGAIGSYYATNGYAMDLTQYAADNNWEDLFLEPALELAKWNGVVYGVPMTYNTFDVMYRSDIFESLGLSEPATWDEFENCLAVLKESGITPFAIGNSSAWDLSRLFALTLEAIAGSEEYDRLCKEQTADWSTNESVIATLNKLKEWYDKGYFLEGFMTLAPNDARNLWYQGQCGMRVDGFVWNMISNDRDMSQYGVFHMPSQHAGENTRCSTYNTCVMINPSVDENQFAVAVDFLEYALTNPDFDSYKSYPVSYKAVTHPDVEGFELLEEILADNEAYGTMPTIDTALSTEVFAKLNSAMEMCLTGDISVEEAAGMVQAQLAAEG